MIADATGRYTRTYDAARQVRDVMFLTGHVLTILRDALSRRAVLVDPDAGRTTYAYDAAGRIALLTDPLGNRTTYAYDAAGHNVETLLPKGTRTTVLHDAAGRILRQSDLKSDDSVVSRFDSAYDAAGRCTARSESDWQGPVARTTFACGVWATSCRRRRTADVSANPQPPIGNEDRAGRRAGGSSRGGAAERNG